ncbi:condensin subunit Smc [Natranaerovirga hydrolytica]|uniref:Chromosome partition protein Smc n=1 Tax=Natranaerovirga hydrolytica TaxID=680378 RepID=A0A4V2Q1N4_9FIRM|nr:chromosome segregation protein SMC [Natranaerovirga hydrolytica]TCK98311.1 condensin subunit Smc [Natranaerovirga hydrolytica]
MYLKNIELYGFKSFANKIQLTFNNGITGIVGPNGSGKSNVADAVRWVLGEQSAKQLRGSKMEDVIFAGTENRRQLGYSSVSITIDNSDKKLPIDFSEVTVARRVYRSGESEYSINGSNCRLKDVQELFFDTGIGKEGYSIIGQGQIDKILSSKPEDRRDLFDEAAGIVKYKKRKSVAEKKLLEEKQNLNRVSDILSEIEKQISPLEKQSKVAKEFLDLKEQLKIYDINIFIRELEALNKEKEDYITKEQTIQHQIVTTQEELSSTKEKNEALENEIEALKDKIEEEKESLSQSQLNNEKLDNQINIINEQISSIKKSNVHIEERIELLQQKSQSTLNEKKDLLQQKDGLAEGLSTKKVKLNTLETEIEAISRSISTSNQKIETLKSNIIEYLNEISAINNKIQRYETMQEHITIRKSELHQKYLKVSKEEEETKIINEEEIEKYKKLINQINQVANEKEHIEKNLNEITLNKSQNINDYNAKKNKYNQMHSRYDALKNIADQYEGYNFSIRKIMEYKEKADGIIGVVADVVKVKKKYELAIETALGGSIQHVITQDEHIAKRLVEYLKTNKFGRATFLPLTTIVGRNQYTEDKVLKETGVINKASELVDCDHRYNHLIEHLLGRVIVVDTIDNGIALAKKYKQSLRIVTLTGEILNPGGSITGGSYKNNNNFLGRQREIENLQKELTVLNEAIHLLEQEKEKIENQENDFKLKYEDLKINIQEYKLNQNTSQINLNQRKEALQKLEEEKEDIQKEMAELDNQFVEVEENIKELNHTLDQLKENNKKSEEAIETINKEMESTNKSHAEKIEEVTELRIKISSIEQELNYIKTNIQKLNNEYESGIQEIETLEQSLVKHTEDMKEKENQILVLKEKISEGFIEKKEKENQIEALKSEHENKVKAHKNYIQEKETIIERMTLLDKESFRINTRKERIDESIKQQIDYMWNEYEVTYHQSLGLKKDMETNISGMKKEVQKIKNTIKALGDVNVNAIEDYKKLVERFEFLQTQRDDLLEAEEKLLNIVIELDKAMRDQFKEKFKEINQQFNTVFKELFGGGKGFLELTNEEDILESGIKINAQPPGKKLQNMMLLSGGERAFTAIALLFAIQKLKPSPFCVLDEIEAALDDANVERFARYLHKLSKDTQFIIITHRKGTMESADALYGITMQEKGISTLVSVKLIENEMI